MAIFGAYEAKIHLSSLLERVAQGESFTITRHGSSVAKLVPAKQCHPERINAAIRRIRTVAAGQTLGGDWRVFRDAGRKW